MPTSTPHEESGYRVAVDRRWVSLAAVVLAAVVVSVLVEMVGGGEVLRLVLIALVGAPLTAWGVAYSTNRQTTREPVQQEQKQPVALLDDPQEAEPLDSLSIYLRSIRRMKPLPAMQERELLARAGHGDLVAKQRVVEAHLPLVLSVAKAHLGQGPPFLDLLQEGSIGLLRAVEEFRPEQGQPFTQHAERAIRRAIVPMLVGQHKSRLRLEELADDPAAYGDALPKPIADDPHEAAVANELREQITSTLAALTERERQVIELRYGMSGGRPLTNAQIARMLAVPEGTVKMMQHRALQRIRRQLDEVEAAIRSHTS